MVQAGRRTPDRMGFRPARSCPGPTDAIMARKQPGPIRGRVAAGLDGGRDWLRLRAQRRVLPAAVHRVGRRSMPDSIKEECVMVISVAEKRRWPRSPRWGRQSASASSSSASSKRYDAGNHGRMGRPAGRIGHLATTSNQVRRDPRRCIHRPHRPLLAAGSQHGLDPRPAHVRHRVTVRTLLARVPWFDAAATRPAARLGPVLAAAEEG
jgi:hypothetical protein